MARWSSDGIRFSVSRHLFAAMFAVLVHKWRFTLDWIKDSLAHVMERMVWEQTQVGWYMGKKMNVLISLLLFAHQLGGRSECWTVEKKKQEMI